MKFGRRILAAVALVGVAALAVTGCSATDPSSPGSDDGRLQVVAVTDVYGDIAAQIGGDRVDVTSIVSGTAVDPHEYEASTRDQLRISEADLVILNGGGLDDFMQQLIAASGTEALVINAVEASGLLPAGTQLDDDHDHGQSADTGHDHIAGFNEHVWYSLHGVEQIARAVEAALVALDPEGAATIRAGAEQFLEGVATLDARAHEVAGQLSGGDVIATEPVSGYLLSDLGLSDVTPEAFVSAVEEGTGVGVRLLDQVLSLVAGHDIRMLAENAQAGGLEAQQVRDAAIAAEVPVVAFSETLPSGEDYLSWMSANIEAVASALR